MITRNNILDEKDLQILKVLQENGRLSIREVAAKINLSSTPTQERIRRLEREGVILQYAALVDQKKIYKGTTVLCQVTLTKHNKDAAYQFIEKIMSFNEVVECYNIAGDYDFSLKIITESIESYHDFFVNQLSEVPFIGNTKSTFVMSAIKQTHMLVF
jgi:Lrp/AsnC family leucine-responsive transcriptional regulator